MTIIGTLVYVWVMNHGTYWKDPLSDRGVSEFMWNADINSCVSERFWLLEGLGRPPLLNKLKRQRKTQFNAGEAFRLQITCFARPRICSHYLHRYIFLYIHTRAQTYVHTYLLCRCYVYIIVDSICKANSNSRDHQNPRLIIQFVIGNS